MAGFCVERGNLNDGAKGESQVEALQGFEYQYMIQGRIDP